MSKYVVNHNVLFLSDKDGVTHTHERGTEVELDADTAERLLRYGTVEEPSKDAPEPEPKRTRRAAQPSQPAPEAVKDADAKE